MKPLRIPLRIVLYRDGPEWVAHCLELDLIGDGASKADAVMSLREAVELQVRASVEVDNPRNLFSPADADVFERFAAGQDLDVGEFQVRVDPVTIERADAREYSGAEDAEADRVAAYA